MRHLGRRRAIATGVVIAAPLLCVAVSVGALLMRRPALTSHTEVVRYMLETRGHRVLSITTSAKWPEAVNYYAYGWKVYPYSTNIEVKLGSGGRVLGSVECHRDRYDCQVTIDDLGIEREPMPDVEPDVNNSLWPRWAVRLARRLGLAP